MLPNTLLVLAAVSLAPLYGAAAHQSYQYSHARRSLEHSGPHRHARVRAPAVDLGIQHRKRGLLDDLGLGGDSSTAVPTQTATDSSSSAEPTSTDSVTTADATTTKTSTISEAETTTSASSASSDPVTTPSASSESASSEPASSARPTTTDCGLLGLNCVLSPSPTPTPTPTPDPSTTQPTQTSEPEPTTSAGVATSDGLTDSVLPTNTPSASPSEPAPNTSAAPPSATESASASEATSSKPLISLDLPLTSDVLSPSPSAAPTQSSPAPSASNPASASSASNQASASSASNSVIQSNIASITSDVFSETDVPTSAVVPTATTRAPSVSVSAAPTATASSESDTEDITSRVFTTTGQVTFTNTRSASATDSASESQITTVSGTRTNTYTATNTRSDTASSQTNTGSVSSQTASATVSGTRTDTASQSTETDTASGTRTHTVSGTRTRTGTASESTEIVTFPTASRNQTTSTSSGSISGTGTRSATATITDSASSSSTTAQALPSQFSFLTASSLVVPTETSTSSVVSATQTDPDAALTSSAPTGGTATVAPVFPSALPTRIVPLVGGVDPVRDAAALKGYTLISLLFTNQLSWVFVTKSSEATGQLFAYTPVMIATALGLTADQVKTFALQAFTPATFTGDASQIRTLFLAYIPSNEVDNLASQLRAKQSALYTGQTSTIPSQLAALIDPSLPVNSVNSGSSGTTTPNSGSTGSGSNADSSNAGSDNSRRDTIIGVCTAFAIILLAVAGWFAVRSAKRKREERHRPISPTYERAGMQSPSDRMEERPRSFFFAEDSLRGHQAGAHAVSDEYNYRQAPAHRRVPVQTSAISAPVLRESSLNW